MWERGDRDEALIALRDFCDALRHDLPIKPGESRVSHQERGSEISQVLARCYLKAGEWQTEMKAEWTSVSCTWLIVSQANSRPVEHQKHSPSLFLCHPVRPKVVQSVAYLVAS